MKWLKDCLNKRFFNIPVYGYIAGIGMFILQRYMYLWANDISLALGIGWHTTKIAWLDDLIPLYLPFITVYILSYLFWIYGPMAVAKDGTKDHFKDFLIGMFVAYLIGAIVFTVYPTRMDRVAENLLNDNPGVLNQALQWGYNMDGGRYGTNLAPSYHCLISTCCYMGVAKRSEYAKSYRIFSAVFCVFIFASTVLCKQHYFIDIPAGIIIGYIAMKLAMKYHWGKVLTF